MFVDAKAKSLETENTELICNLRVTRASDKVKPNYAARSLFSLNDLNKGT